MTKGLERRILAQEFRVQGDDAPHILGYAAVFDSRADIGGWFFEEVDARAFDTVMSGNPDVRGLFNHDPNLILGRTTAGTMSLSVDARGLAYDITPPDTQLARDLIVSMKRKDITQSSYAFIVARDQWTDNPDGSITRRILEIAELYDVSPVTYPAFNATSAQARAEERARLGGLPESMPAELRERIAVGAPIAKPEAAAPADDWQHRAHIRLGLALRRRV